MSAQMKRFTLRASAATTSAETTVGSWLDVSGFNELYLALNVTAFAARANETLDVTVERKNLTTTGYATIATFTQIATTGAHDEEKTVNFTTGLIGGKIRVRCITGGTWSTKTMTFEVVGEAKRV